MTARHNGGLLFAVVDFLTFGEKMFEILGNFVSGVTKVAVGAVVAPVALAIDVVTIPASSMDLHRGPFDRTQGALKLISEGVTDAVKTTK